LKNAKKWPNGQTIIFLANSFKKGQNWQIWPLKRPNGNPEAYDDVTRSLALHHSPFCSEPNPP